MVSQNSTNDIDLLFEVSRLFAHDDLDAMLRSMADLAAEKVNATDASLILTAHNRQHWYYVLDTQSDGLEVTNEHVDDILRQGLAGWVLRYRELVLVKDTREDERWHHMEIVKDVRSALCVPLIHRDELVGVFTLVHTNPGHFTQQHVHLMTIISNQAAIAVYNARLLDEVRSQQQRLKSMLGALRDALVILDENGKIMLANPAGSALLGMSKSDDLVEQNLLELTKRDDGLEPLRKVISRPMDEVDPEELNFEIRLGHLNRDYTVTLSPWADEQQRGYIVILHDITALRDLGRFKDDIMLMVSHDLRSPLALVVGYANMITLDTPDPESPVHEYVEVIQHASNRMSMMLEEFLRVEQVRNSPLELHESIDPQKLIKVVLVNARYDVEKKHQKLRSEVRLEANRLLRGDQLLIRQSMENLINNAVKYTPEGGQITIYVHDHDEDGRFHFSVEDNGVGISEENQAHVFDTFYRASTPEASPENSERPSGIGLGLSLVKTVVERHGGQVWVNSIEGEGSHFGFWLPMYDAGNEELTAGEVIAPD